MQATIVVTILFVLALVGAWFVFKVLHGTATIKRKGVQLGGAAAMFVVMFFLLNRYLPDIRDGLIKEAAAQPIQGPTGTDYAEVAQVSLSPATQLISARELSHLDRNKYDVREDMGIAMPRQISAHWDLGPVNTLPVLGYGDIPALRTGLEVFRYMFEGERPLILGVQEKKPKLVTLDRNSMIGGVPLTLNYFDDRQYMKAAMKASAGMLRQLGITASVEDISESDLENVRTMLRASFQASIDKKLPVRKELRNGVFVMTLKKESLENNLFTKVTGLSNSLLDKALLKVVMSGYFTQGGLGNMYADQRRGIISFNANVRVSKARLDESTVDFVLNTIGFIVTSEDRAYFVLLIYDSTSEIQIYKELETFLNNLRFAT